MFLGVLISSSPRVGESAGPGAEDAAPASEDSAPAAEERAPPAADAAAPAPESAPSAADVAPTPEEPAPPAADVTPPPEEPAPSAGAPSPSSEGQPGKYAGSCMQDGCHATLKEQANLHGPVAAESCGVCHSAVEGKEHAFELSREEEELCTFCHDMPDPAKVVHKPFEQKACLGCHDPHGGATRAFLIKEEEPGGVCLGCHSRSDAKGLHKPVSEGRCTQCHTPHQSESEKLLVDSGSTTCLACHSKLAESFQAAKSVHKPAAEGQCRPCHRGHESSFGALLASSYPRKPYAGFDEKTYALCLQCHPVEAFTEEQTTRTGFRDGTRNLHYLHANKPRKGRTCGMCHAPHESAEQHLLKKEVPFGTWKLAIGFEPTADGGTCATGCHRKATYARGPASPGPAGSGAEEAGKPAAKAGSAAPKKAKKTRKASPPGADVGSPGK